MNASNVSPWFSRRLTAVASAALICSCNGAFAQDVVGAGLSAYQSGLSFRESLSNGLGSVLAHRRTELVDEVQTRPVIVQGVVGSTVVANSTIVNFGAIDSGGSAAQLQVACPRGGGRVLMHGNRVVNLGRIRSDSDDGAAASVMESCPVPSMFRGSDYSSDNSFSNLGQIQTRSK